MATIPLQPGIIYGPVLSRRLGRSLGINLMPADRKICSFDCVYCQYGETQTLTALPAESIIPTTSAALSAVEKALKKPRTIDFLTFSGNGEPTIHPHFPDIVRGVKEIRDRLSPNAKLALLSNASQLHCPSIIDAIHLIDSPMMKLDAGDEETFRLINRPLGDIQFQTILDGLHEIPHLMIQSLLIDGQISNIRGEAFENWVRVLKELQPKAIHIYSLDRPTPVDVLKRVDPPTLQKIEHILNHDHDLNVEAFWREG